MNACLPESVQFDNYLDIMLTLSLNMPQKVLQCTEKPVKEF